MGVAWNPHDYQQRGIAFCLERGGAGVFMDPGLGKTSVMLAVFKILKAKGYVNRMLVIAPLRVCQLVWRQEGQKWEQFRGIRFRFLHGSDKEWQARQDADVYLINPAGIHAHKRSFYFDYAHQFVKPDMLVIDESTKFKNPTSHRYKALRKNLNSFRRRYILTGTPAPKSFEDLFGQIYIVDKGASLGPYITHYRREHFDQGGFGNFSYTLKEGHDQIILDKIAPYCLRMEAKDYLELPELIPNTIEVELPAEVQAAYDELEEEFIINLQDTEITALSAASLSIKLRQLCNGGVYDSDGAALQLHDAKCEALGDLLEEAGSPVLCGYQFKHDITRIREYLGYEVPYIGSGIKEKVAVALVNAFNRGELPLLLAHPDSVGHGLNLQELSNHVAFFGVPWDLEQYMQFILRVQRQGNPNKRVFLHHLITNTPVERGMMMALTRKDRTQRAMLNFLKEYYRRMTSGESIEWESGSGGGRSGEQSSPDGSQQGVEG